MGIKQFGVAPPAPGRNGQYELAYARDKWAYERLFKGPKPKKKLYPYDGRVRSAMDVGREMGVTGPNVLMAARRHALRSYLLEHGGAYVAAVPIKNSTQTRVRAGNFGQVRFHAAEGTHTLYNKYRRGHIKLPLFMGGF